VALVESLVLAIIENYSSTKYDRKVHVTGIDGIEADIVIHKDQADTK